MERKNALTGKQASELISGLKQRFEKNMKRHKGIEWEKVRSRLEKSAGSKLWSLSEMELTGGEPDVTGIDKKTGGSFFATVRRRVRKVAEASAMTVRGSNRERSSGRRTRLLIWPLKWA